MLLTVLRLPCLLSWRGAKRLLLFEETSNSDCCWASLGLFPVTMDSSRTYTKLHVWNVSAIDTALANNFVKRLQDYFRETFLRFLYIRKLIVRRFPFVTVFLWFCVWKCSSASSHWIRWTRHDILWPAKSDRSHRYLFFSFPRSIVFAGSGRIENCQEEDSAFGNKDVDKDVADPKIQCHSE